MSNSTLLVENRPGDGTVTWTENGMNGALITTLLVGAPSGASMSTGTANVAP